MDETTNSAPVPNQDNARFTSLGEQYARTGRGINAAGAWAEAERWNRDVIEALSNCHSPDERMAIKSAFRLGYQTYEAMVQPGLDELYGLPADIIASLKRIRAGLVQFDQLLVELQEQTEVLRIANEFRGKREDDAEK